MGLRLIVGAFLYFRGMVHNWNPKQPPKRKIPKCRVPRSHHYVMIWPIDFKWGNKNLQGMAYISFFDSFLEDCVKAMYKHAPELFDYNENKVMTACLN